MTAQKRRLEIPVQKPVRRTPANVNREAKESLRTVDDAIAHVVHRYGKALKKLERY